MIFSYNIFFYLVKNTQISTIVALGLFKHVLISLQLPSKEDKDKEQGTSLTNLRVSTLWWH